MMMWFLTANAVMWAVWALGTGAYAAGVPSLINGPIALATIFTLRRSRRDDSSAASPAAGSDRCGCGWPSSEPHVMFVVARPGYGSRVPCTGSVHPLAVPVPEMVGASID